MILHICSCTKIARENYDVSSLRVWLQNMYEYSLYYDELTYYYMCIGVYYGFLLAQ